MRLKTEQWLRALLAAIVTGFANAVLSSLGIGGAQLVGVSVPTLNLKQVLTIAISGGFIGACAYLKQSPVPPDSTGGTTTIQKPNP